MLALWKGSDNLMLMWRSFGSGRLTQLIRDAASCRPADAPAPANASNPAVAQTLAPAKPRPVATVKASRVGRRG